MADKTTPGDGTTQGICLSNKCLSSGACNVCGFISGTHQGCDSLSTAPICDADSTTTGIQDSATGKVAQCVSCKKSGKGNALLMSHSTLLSIKEYTLHKCKPFL